MSTFWQVRCCEHRTQRSCQKYNKYFFKFCGLLRKPKLYSNLWNLSQANQTSVCRSIYSHICQPHIFYIFINFNFLGSMQYINKAEQATALAANMSQQIWAWTHPSQQCHQSFLTKNGSRMMFSSFCTTVLCIFLTQWGEIIFNELKNYSYVTVRHCCTFLARAQYFKGQFYRKR